MGPPILLVPALLLAGCTFQAGEGFGRIAAADLDLAFEPGAARDLGDGAVLTDQGYTVALTELTLSVGRVELQELQGAVGVVFDPANPPDGYSLCHGGHCHADDGALVPYEDVIAELSGGTAEYVTVTGADLDREVDLLGGDQQALAFDQAFLPQADLSRFLLTASRLTATAQVTSDALTAPVPLRVDLAFDDGFSTTIDLPVDRDHDPAITLSAAVLPDGTLFDDIDFDGLPVEADGSIVLDDALDGGAGQSVFAALVSSLPAITITRTP